jgi:hypothetical protein
VDRQLFLSGLVVMAGFGLAHLGGFIQGAYAARHDPKMANLTRAMREHRFSLLGLKPSILDFREYFSLNFSILLFLGSAIGMVSLKVAPDHAAIIHMLSPVYVAAMLLLLGTSIRFSVVQGIVTCPMIAILFGLAWWLS